MFRIKLFNIEWTLYALYMHAHNVTVFTNVCIYSLQGDERVIYSIQGDDDGESVI